ncbi:MAG: AIPR protein [Firmicutes bacterium HGW-Firmicutes-2]|jgi:hypothetical protein|nr:MAG: AIPR protein [Firmicutes bacterium HGW-Firmicutes-2]
MGMQEYRKELLEEVKATAESDYDGTTSSFVSVVSDLLINIDIMSDFYSSFCKGEGKRKRKFRIDGYYFDDWDLTLTLLVADYKGNEESDVITKSEALTGFSRGKNFVDEILNSNLMKSLELSHPAYDLGETITRNYANGNLKKIKVILITDRVASERIDSFDNEQINGTAIEYHLWDISRFFRVCGSDDGKNTIEIDFKELNGMGIPCVEAKGLASKDYRCFLCVISGNMLADLYDKYGSLLLEGNVRAFLSVRGKVNKSIRSTIINPDKSPLFFALNNGIAATVTDVVTENIDGTTYVTYAKDLQIVNGGQTTASLSNARFKDKVGLDSIFVQMKLTEVEPTLAEELIPQISKSSNSQNKVSEADFFSNHPFHIRFEQFSRRIFAPAAEGAQFETKWFYERARGQYNQQQIKMTSSEKRKFGIQNPKNQLVTKTDLAKVWNSWEGYPHIVSKGAQANFIHYANMISSEWDKNDLVYNEIFFQESIALMILFKNTEKLVTDQTWYEKGYRANIVTYSLALLAKTLKNNYPKKKLDLLKIWGLQSIPNALNVELTKITKEVFLSITSSDRETVNVTQWCKREKCWHKIEDIKVMIETDVETYLIDLKDKKNIISDAKKEQRILNGIEAQVFIVNLGQAYWNEMFLWAREKKLISQKEAEILKLASKMSAQKMPNSYQSKILQSIRVKLVDEGFREY